MGKTGREVTVWTDTGHVELVHTVLDLMGSAIRPIGVGGPRNAAVDRLAKIFNCTRLDDPRQLLVERPATFLLVATTESIDHEHICGAANGGTVVLTMEPLATELSQLLALRFVARNIIRVPGFMYSPGAVRATDPREEIGTRRTMAYFSYVPSQVGSLFGRLLEAWTAMLWFGPLPETIDASLTGSRTSIPENLSDITGVVSAHARMASDSAAVIHVADRAGHFGRCLHVLGADGQLCITDGGYQLSDRHGNEMDRAGQNEQVMGTADLVAVQWQALLDRTDLKRPEVAETDALACCLACLLSARTGQPESPQSILQMSGLSPHDSSG